MSLKKYVLHLTSPFFEVFLSELKNLMVSKPLNSVLFLKTACLLYCLLSSLTVFAQYTNVINSNRPSFSESPYAVGTGVYQLETSIFYKKKKKDPTLSKPQSNGTDILFRTSFLKEKLELNINLAVQKEQVYFQNIFNSSYFKTNFSKLIVGGKYLIYEQKYTDKSKEIRSWVARNSFDHKRLIPSVAIHVSLNTRVPSSILKANSVSPKVGLLFQNDLTKSFNIITNIFYNYIGTGLEELSFITTATYNLNGRFSSFIENQTVLGSREYQSDIGSGIAFLFNKNLQINSSLRLLVAENTTGIYVSVGACYRLDKHMDRISKLSDKKTLVDEQEQPFLIKRKSFFGKILNRATKVFKNNKKQVIREAESKIKLSDSIREDTNSNQNDTVNNDTKKSSLKIEMKNNNDKDTKELKKEIKKLEKEIRKEKRKLERGKRKVNTKKEEKEIKA